MAIQNRRGQSADFVASKMVPGEFAVSQDNRKLYLCFTAGNVKEIAIAEDMANAISEMNLVMKEWHDEVVEDTEDKVEDAEAWAQGTRGGTPVPSTDPTYQHNAKYYAENIVDNTLSIAGKAADAKKTGDEISDLKDDLNARNVEYSDTSLWEIGGIALATGLNWDSTNRIRTGYISRALVNVTPANGYKTGIYVYNSSGTYLGMYNGTGYQTDSLYWNTSIVNLSTIPSEYKIRISVAKDPDGQMDVEDGLNILFGSYTDASLTQSGKAADAKAVGDAISAIEPGLSEEAKQALLDCFEHVAWVDEHGQDYYDALYEALYEEPPMHWDYEWDVSSGTAPVDANGNNYPGSISNNLFVLSTVSTGYFLPFANTSPIMMEIEFNLVNVYPSDWFPVFNFAISDTQGFYFGRTGSDERRTDISGGYVHFGTFPQVGTLHKLVVTASSNGCSYKLNDEEVVTGPGVVNRANLSITGVQLAVGQNDLLGIKSIKYKYLAT